MKKRILMALSVLMVLLQSCGHQEDYNPLAPQDEQREVLSKDQLDQVIFDILKDTKAFKWNDLNDDQLASAFLLSDKVVTVAWDYDAKTDAAKEAIVALINQYENASGDKTDIILSVDDELNFLDAKIEKVETLLALRHMEETVALDVYYEMFSEEALANSLKPAADLRQNPEDEPSERTPATLDVATNHNIPDAWAAGLTGKGIKIAVVDGGLLKDDEVFGNNGNADGDNPFARSVQKKGYYKRKWWNPFASFDGPYARSSGLSADHGT
ncbi:MAG: hypothetical protein AAF990_28215, partial [Bacteroidota bacterium]